MDREDIKDRLEDLDTHSKLNLRRNGYTVLREVDNLDYDQIYAEDLEYTGRNPTEIGRTLTVFEEFYDIELREEVEESGPFLWNIDKLRGLKGNEVLKELLSPD